MAEDGMLSPALLLSAYQQGVFPMADHRHAKHIHWYAPHMRGILPFDTFHVPKRLYQKLKQRPFNVSFDRQFKNVVISCAGMRSETWINDDIIENYTQLHHMGYAHSAEVTTDTGQLVGGVYGIAMGGVFFGESMFSIETDASKIALVHLMARLYLRGYQLFDTQMMNDHLKQFGCIEMPHVDFMQALENALAQPVTFYSSDNFSGAVGAVGETVSSSGECSGVFSDEKSSDFAEVDLFLQSITQTS